MIFSKFFLGFSAFVFLFPTFSAANQEIYRWQDTGRGKSPHQPRYLDPADFPADPYQSWKREREKGMVIIPAGTFRMGSNNGDSDEKPMHDVYLDAYAIDKYEVTLAQYKKCVDAGKCKTPKTGRYYNRGKSGRSRHPINGVSWYDAKDYCEFAEKRLPTEAEWEKAATWKNGKKYKYPSGKNSISCQDAVMDDGGDGCGKNRTWEVGSKPKEINGTYDMAGNVWEWVSDRYGDYPSSKQNPTGPSSGRYRVNRGGGWFDGSASFLRGADRLSISPSRRGNYLGFRCVLSPGLLE